MITSITFSSDESSDLNIYFDEGRIVFDANGVATLSKEDARELADFIINYISEAANDKRS